MSKLAAALLFLSILSFGSCSDYMGSEIERILLMEWCEMDCGNVTNIACVNKETCDGAGRCHPAEWDEFFRTDVINAHNQLRSQFAINHSISNMAFMNYHMELEYVARCRCSDCSRNVSECPITEKFQDVGQSTYVVPVSTKRADHDKYVFEVVKGWMNGGEAAAASMIGSYTEGKASNYTQMVWAETTHVGCARFRDSRDFYFCCNYGPKGNVAGQPIGKKGKPCTECPKDETCNEDFPSLCGATEDVCFERWDMYVERRASSTKPQPFVAFVQVVALIKLVF